MIVMKVMITVENLGLAVGDSFSVAVCSMEGLRSLRGQALLS